MPSHDTAPLLQEKLDLEKMPPQTYSPNWEPGDRLFLTRLFLELTQVNLWAAATTSQCLAEEARRSKETLATATPLPTERGKRDVDCDKQVGKVVTVLNCMLKGSWGEGESGGIRKKLKNEYATYLESKYRKNDGSLI